MTDHTRKEGTTHEGGSESVREPAQKPVLAENEAEALAKVAGGRSLVSLRESKTFDSERLAESPLFDRRLF